MLLRPSEEMSKRYKDVSMVVGAFVESRRVSKALSGESGFFFDL